jgi:hypothetical protein
MSARVAGSAGQSLGMWAVVQSAIARRDDSSGVWGGSKRFTSASEVGDPLIAAAFGAADVSAVGFDEGPPGGLGGRELGAGSAAVVRVVCGHAGEGGSVDRFKLRSGCVDLLREAFDLLAIAGLRAVILSAGWHKGQEQRAREEKSAESQRHGASGVARTWPFRIPAQYFGCLKWTGAVKRGTSLSWAAVEGSIL